MSAGKSVTYHLLKTRECCHNTKTYKSKLVKVPNLEQNTWMLSELNDRPIKPVDVKNLKTNEIHKKAIELRVFLDAKKKPIISINEIHVWKS